MMERPRYFEDYVVGESRSTTGRTITETDFVVHAGHTGDFFPHHMDAEAMKASEWGQRIAHGTMTFAIGIGLTASEINPLAFHMEVPPTAKLVNKFILPPPPALPPLLGQSPGHFQFVDLDGQQVERESLAGKVVVLDLWATWCGWCFEGLPLLESVYQKYKDDDRVVILAVSKEETAVSNERVRQSFAEH